MLNLPGGAQIPPAPDTDLIYAVIVNELGLFGATGVVLAYLLFAERGFRVAVLAEDGFTKLLAAGLTAVFALQAFVIVGGVTRVIPLTGVTLPFVSYGGSSIVANFVLLALLLMVSEQARAPRARHSPVVDDEGAGVNARIRNLFGLVTGLFVVLIAFTTYWSVFQADELEANRANKRPLLEEQQIRRGLIVAREGTVIARNRAVGDSPRFYERLYPEGGLFGHPVGYSFVERGRVALEREYNDDLTGKTDEFTSLFDEVRGREREGNDIFTNLDPQAQQVARDGLAGRAGSVVALDPRTGRVRVLVSIPGYDPNEIPQPLQRPAPGAPLAAARPRGAERVPARLHLQGGDRDRRDRLAASTPRLGRGREVAEAHRRSPARELRQ